jgi:hypothetical protein
LTRPATRGRQFPDLRASARGAFVAGIERRRRKVNERGPISRQAFADRCISAAQNRALAGLTALQQHGVQFVEIAGARERNHEVPPRIPDHALDLAFVVSLAGAAKPVVEKIVRLQLGKGLGSSAFAIR